MLLSEIECGKRFAVSRILLQGEVGKRLGDIGFIKDARGVVVRRSLFRGPAQVALGKSSIIVRHREECGVEVSACGADHENEGINQPEENNE